MLPGNSDFAMRSWESRASPENDVWEHAAPSVETEFMRPKTSSLPAEPTVSVVVPFYGADDSTLIKCVESLEKIGVPSLSSYSAGEVGPIAYKFAARVPRRERRRPRSPTAKAAPEEELDRRNGYGAAVCGI